MSNINNPSFNVDQNGNLQGDSEQFSSNSWLSDATNTIASAIDSLVANGVYSYYDNSGSYIVQTMRSDCLKRASQIRYSVQAKTVEVRYLSSGQWSAWSAIGGSALNYKGPWNASTNTPTLTSSVGNVGDLYIVSVAGTTNLDNITNWTLGDQVIFSSANKWTRIPAGNVDIVTAGIGISVDNSTPNESVVNLLPAKLSVIGGVKANTRPAGQFVTGIDTTDGSLQYDTPVGSVQSVTGNIVNVTDPKNPVVNLPISQSNVLGGIKTGTRADGQFVTGFDATGLATYATPTGAVVSVSAGFGLEPDSTSTATNPVLRTKQSTNDYSTNRSGLDVVTLASGLYRTVADKNNPSIAGTSIWLVEIIKGDDGGSSSVQHWSSADPTSISSFFTRSTINGTAYSNFERVTIDGVVSLSGNLVTNGNTSAPSVNLLPAGTTAIGGVIAGSPTAPSEQFVQGVNPDGTLKYAIPAASGVRAVVSIDFSGNVPTSSVSDEIISFAFSSDFSAILNGETWTAVQPSIVLFNTLFQVNSTTLLAGTNGGIYRSTDSGSTWSSISSTRSNSFNAFIFQSGSTTNIFAGADNAIWRSTDSGVTWTNTGGRPGVMAFTYFTIDSTNNLVAGATGGTLHYSADGNSWSTVQVASSGAAINTLFATSTTILAGADGIYSSNNLSTWSGIAGVSNTLTFKAFYLLGTDIFASSGIGVWKSSTSSPTNWSVVNSTQTSVNGFLSLDSALFAVSNYGIYKSTNNGVTWGSSLQSGSFSSLINSGTQLVAASNDGTGIYLSKPATFSITLPAHNSYSQQTITFAPTVNSNAANAITSLQNLIAATRATYTFNTVGTTLNVDTNSSGNITDTTLVKNGTIAGTVTLTIMNGGTSSPLPTITITDPRSGGGSFAYSPAAGSSNIDFCNKISVGENLPNYWFSVTGYDSTTARLLLESISYGNITGLEPTVTITNPGTLSYVRTIISTGSGINGGGGGGGGGGSGSVNSVSAGFGLELNSNSTTANPIIQTKATTNDYSSAANRALLDGVNLASGIYRTVADATNPANSGTASWVVTVYEGDTNSGSTQYWSLLNSTPKIFVRSVSTNNVYGSFVEITGQGDDYVLPPATQLNLGGIKTGTSNTGQFVTGFDANGVTQYASVPIATATGLGVVKGNSGTTGQFVNGIASDGSLQYATPTPTPSLIFSQRNPRQLFSTSDVNNGNTTVTFGVDVTATGSNLYIPGYKFAFLSRPTSLTFTVVTSAFSNGVSTVTFSPAANDTYPSGTQMWEVAQNTPSIVAEGDGIEFDEEGSLTIISLNPPNATTLGGISTGSPTTGTFVQGVNSDGSLKYAIPPGTQYSLPVATQLILGGIKTGAPATGAFVNSFDANGVAQYGSIPAASATSIGGVKANAGEANQFVNGIASDGSLIYATPAGGATNAVLLGTNTYSTTDITAINGGNGKFTLGSNATGAIEMSTKTLVSSPTALPLTAAPSGIQVGAHVLTSPATIAMVSGNNVNFINNLPTPTSTILSPNAQTMAGATAAGSVIVSSDVDEDGALWIMIDYSVTDFKLVKLSFSNYSTTPTYIASNVFTIVAPLGQFIGEINEFGITKVSTGNYKIVMTGTAVGAPSDAAHVYTATVTLSGSTLTVNTPSTLGPQLANAVYCAKISNTYGTYAASLSGGQVWKLNSTSTAWNLLYTISPTDQSSQMQIDRSNGNVWVAFDTEEVIRIDQNNNVTQFPKSTLLNYTNVDEGQNTWGIIANGQTASIITYATLTSTSVNANYLLFLSSNAVVKVLDDLQLTNQIIDSVSSQGTNGQVLTVVNNNPTWASTRNVLVFQLASNTTPAAQATVPFPAAPFITIGKPFGTMNNGVFTASRNVNVRMDFVYNVNATVDSWGAVNANWTTGNRYMQLSSNDLKGSVSQIVPMNAGDTFQYRANNTVQWFGGSGTGTYLEMEALD